MDLLSVVFLVNYSRLSRSSTILGACTGHSMNVWSTTPRQRQGFNTDILCWSFVPKWPSGVGVFEAKSHSKSPWNLRTVLGIRGTISQISLLNQFHRCPTITCTSLGFYDLGTKHRTHCGNGGEVEPLRSLRILPDFTYIVGAIGDCTWMHSSTNWRIPQIPRLSSSF